MKKKVFFTIALIILIISEISIVYADLIIPGQHFNSYSSSEKLEKFNDYMKSPLKEFIAILIILFVVLGLILLTFRAIKNKEHDNEKENNSFMQILQRIFLGTNVVLSLISIYLIKIIRLFDIEFNPVTFVDTRAETAQSFMISLYVVYAIIMFVFSMISVKKKNKRIVYITATCLTIAILLICFITFNNTSIGYYTYDNSYYDFFNFK